ncbi:MAG: hypothetical protein IPM11_00460 [Micropruina sp.]|nr:hypothetical protein [Micropruina sp.]
MLFFGATSVSRVEPHRVELGTPVTTNGHLTPAAAYQPGDVNTIATYLRGQQDIFRRSGVEQHPGTSLTIATGRLRAPLCRS